MKMNQEILRELSKHPVDLSVTSQSLLYKVNLSGSIEPSEESLMFSMEGTIRLGPINSEVVAQSRYELVGKFYQLIDFMIEAPKLKFSENYLWQDDQMIFIKNKKSPVLIKKEEDSFLDPLPLIFHMAQQAKHNVFPKSGRLLVGGRNREFSIEENDTGLELFTEEKKLLNGLIKSDGIQIEVPKYKVKVLLSAKPSENS